METACPIKNYLKTALLTILILIRSSFFGTLISFIGDYCQRQVIHWADDDGVFNAGQLLTGTIEVFLIKKKTSETELALCYTLFTLFTRYGLLQNMGVDGLDG